MITIVLKGGPGSGFEDHRGIPGHQGGSLPEGEGSDVGELHLHISDFSAKRPEKFIPTYYSRSEVEAKFGRHEKSFASKLSDEEKNALIEYTDTGSYINEALRNHKIEDEDRKSIELLDSAIGKSSFPSTAAVERYMVVPKDTNLSELQNKTFQDHAYLSTSLESGKYKDFMVDYIENQLSIGSETDDWMVVAMRIIIPKGSHAALLQGIGTDYSTSEVLLPRDAKLSVDAVYEVKNEKYKAGKYKTFAMSMVYND